jgi:tetratricopeptide (TPR) repeat protein
VELVLAQRNLAVSGIKLGKPKQALADVEEGLKEEPNDPYLLGLKAMLVASQRPAESESLFARSQRGGAASSDFLYQYGILLVNAGRPVEALEVLDRGLGLSPGSHEIELARAEALDRAGRFAEAEKAFRALLTGEHAEVAKRGLARTLLRAGRWADALEIYRQLEETPEVLDRIAACLHGLGRTEEAIASQRKALAAKPDWHQGMLNLAVYLAAAGEIDEAERLLESIVAADPENAIARINLERVREARAKGR